MPIQLYRYYLNSLLSIDGQRRPDDVTIQHYYLAKATPLQACLAIVASRTVQGLEEARFGENSNGPHSSR